MKKNIIQSVSLVIFLTLILNQISAQKVFFKEISENSLNKNSLKRVIKPFKYKTMVLDTTSLEDFLKTIPSEQAVIAKTKPASVITLPLPNGSSAKFKIWESAAMAPELAAQFPDIKTFTGQGVDDPTATIKLDWTPLGFHAMILSPVTTAIFIDTYEQNNRANYIAYFKSDFIKKEAFIESGVIKNATAARPAQTEAIQCIGTQLRTYRLAVACTGWIFHKTHGLEYQKAFYQVNSSTSRINKQLLKITSSKDY